jgi:hypothetical protein
MRVLDKSAQECYNNLGFMYGAIKKEGLLSMEMNRIGVLLAVLWGGVFNLPLRAVEFAGGTGVPEDPYQIATVAQLIGMGTDPNLYDRHFVLVADIDLDPNRPGGRVFDRAVIAPDTNDVEYKYQGVGFRGYLDGRGHGVANMHIQGRDYLGLFGYLHSRSAISNLSLDNVVINGEQNVGGLVGVNDGSIWASFGSGKINGERYTGGLAGTNNGRLWSCCCTGSVDGESIVGGFVGLNNGGIGSSYSACLVEGAYHIGGLVGVNSGNGRIQFSYSSGRIIGGFYNIGGLVGYNGEFLQVGERPGSIWASFWDRDSSGCMESDGGTGLSTLEMKDIDTYLDAGWDYSSEKNNGTCDFWQYQDDTYPHLTVISGTVPIKPSGTGTASDPYQVTDANELGAVWYRPFSHYRLMADIDLSSITWSKAVVPYFAGHFDGNGYCIQHLAIEGFGYLGLFGILDANVSDLGLEHVNIIATDNNVGALVGKNNSTVRGCYSTGVISGMRNVGGLVGFYDRLGHMSSNYSAVTVYGNVNVGGLVGFNYGGGISLSYSSGDVEGKDCVGGFVGGNWAFGRILSCYSAGLVRGERDVGGLVGCGHAKRISLSFWDTELSGLNHSSGGIGLGTPQMLDINTYLDVGWNFDEIWMICEGDYPHLQWQGIRCGE